MKTKVCSKCNLSKEISCYNWKNKVKGRYHSFCKNCHSAYRRCHYLKNKKKYIMKARRWNKKQTILLRKFVIKYLDSHPCVDCAEKDIRVLDFDHEGRKFMGTAQMVRNCYSLQAIEREISVCKVRCANCHRRLTFIRGNFWKSKIGL